MIISHILYIRTLPDGRVCHVMPLTFGRGRLSAGFDGSSYAEEW